MKGKLLTGRVVAIDPASGSTSMPGWALFQEGALVAKGVVQLNPKLPVQGRLNALFFALSEGIGHPPPDVIIIEEIRGRMAHVFLTWACGVIVSAFSESELLELPIGFWKAVIPEGYEKSDEEDAMHIGLAAIELAKELQDD